MCAYGRALAHTHTHTLTVFAGQCGAVAPNFTFQRLHLFVTRRFFPHVAVWFLLFECLCVVLHTDGAALCDCSKLCLSAIHATMKALSTGKWVFYFFNATWTFWNSLQGFSVNRKQEAGFFFFCPVLFCYSTFFSPVQK